ncbi:hypothetical protein [Pseudanabaena mucicola]|uniref:CopG family transcriptional regulator n=1 Tax=Pseudanabaena mucicola FACHB-723 TaxID=2692860 RepID=A0ABR7ZZR0_9CYAN|nr:hypothetical protein [Pseudanabaena mucicola]MBD2189491.1 hypothetical protein [Pseudanabaena mucicola FACHB-723]
MQVTIEVSDEVALQANRTGCSVQEFIMQAIQRYIHQEVPLVHTETWQMCGALQVKNNLDMPIHSDLDVVTNYAESIDDVLYGSL